MITSKNFEKALELMEFKTDNGTEYEKRFPDFEVSLKADVKAQKLFYPGNIKGKDRKILN